MSVCANSELFTLEESNPKVTPDEDFKGENDHLLKRGRAKMFKIPHILKRPNKVEQNIREMTEQAIENSRDKREKYALSYETLEVPDGSKIEVETLKKHSKSVFISEINHF